MKKKPEQKKPEQKPTEPRRQATVPISNAPDPQAVDLLRQDIAARERFRMRMQGNTLLIIT